MSKNKKIELGSKRVLKLMARLTVYYLVVFLILWAIADNIPEAREYFPLGGAEGLIGNDAMDAFKAILPSEDFTSNYIERGLRLFFAILGALFVMLPVTWVYMSIRKRSRLDQSLVETMLILPIAVAGVVVIVQNSLALAFSLAGIVAGVRFRNTLKNTGDSLFIFTAIGTGLAAGVGALEIAVVVTVTFNYVFLILWDFDYGAGKAEKYMRPSNSKNKKGE